MRVNDGRWLLVAIAAWTALTLCVFSLPLIAKGEDSLEVLTLKRDLVAEKINRLVLQLDLMRRQYAEGQAAIEQLKKEFDDLSKKIEAMEPKKENPKPKEKK